jgi:hypothetical protein
MPERDLKQRELPGLQRDLTKEERAELRTGRAIRALVASEGWKVYRKIVEAHAQMKLNEMQEPAERGVDGISQILRGESAKGAIFAFRFAIAIPDGILANDQLLRGTLGLGPEDEE